MSWIFVLVIIVIIAVIAMLVIAVRSKTGSSQKQYQQSPLMTDNEKEFLNRLVTALPNHFVFAQVGMGALLEPNFRKSDRSNYQRVRNSYVQKLVDYVVCDKELNVVALIELDDKTHNAKKDADRDAMTNEAGYYVIRWNSKSKPTTVEIAEEIEKVTASATL